MGRLRGSINRSMLSDPIRQSGFTLVELFVVFLIASILTLTTVAVYQRVGRRFVVQDEAAILATRLEQAKSFAQSQNTEYRIRFDQTNNLYLPEFYIPAPTPGWVAADLISSQPINFNQNITYGFGSISASPNYGPTIDTPVQSTEIRFNSRGIPVSTGTPQTAPQAANTVYLTDGNNYFAVTVSILGVVRVWSYNSAANQWFDTSES